MNKWLLFFIVCLCGVNLLGQQVPFYNHYLINPFVYNPAFTGASDYINASFVRNQRYSSFGSTAINNYLTVEGPVSKGNMGLGLIVAYQNQGIQQQLMSSLNYSYRLKINDNHNIRFGVSAGVLDNRIDYNQINAQDISDPYLTGLRPTAPVFDMNVGLVYNWKNLKIGVSVPQIIGAKVKYAKERSRGYYQLERHYMMSLEYDFHAGDKVIIRPNAIMRYMPNVPFQYDVTLMTIYNNMLWASATYKSDYAVQFNAGIRVWDFLRIGYSYELLTGSMKAYSTGTNHEIFLGFSFNGKREKEIQVVENPVIIIDESAVKQRDSVQKLKDELESRLKEIMEDQAQKERLQRERDSLTNLSKVTKTDTVKPKGKPQEVIPIAKGSYFMNLDKSDSPDGYYVITGVFSSKQNAEHALSRCKGEYPDTYLMINKANNYFYVVILYSLDQELATATYKEYKVKKKQKVWILNYRI
ncbi:type IX secretion system membrane protein PorP/SprF [Fluviicola sp.]|jgi:type IX secretion system PorP/SprF family membrane protein|uniref:PorP/SprF family type IX secretion system membrane protein n=1 Tax=Fluviicola sp. TaxID=1917219 RepID=UPI002836F7F2|nr:type IX secretion system membrane protein PorP/SprF [Fluviicola sp.]MDR0801713.1 type IX secretion system membrane protein PorP/SprF [Fluviicola sp.]